MACFAKEDSVLNIVSSIRGIIVNSECEFSRRVYCAKDREIECSNCGTANNAQERIENEIFFVCPVVMRTFDYVSVLIEIPDVIYFHCHEVIWFDIEWEGLFSSSKNYV